MERHVRVGVVCVVLGLALVGGALAGVRPVDPHYELEYTGAPASEPALSTVVSYYTLSESVRWEFGRAPGSFPEAPRNGPQPAGDGRISPAEWEGSTLRGHEYVQTNAIRGDDIVRGYESHYDGLNTGKSPVPLPLGLPLGAATLVYGVRVLQRGRRRALAPRGAAAVAVALVVGGTTAAVLGQLAAPGVPPWLFVGTVVGATGFGVAFFGGVALGPSGAPFAVLLVVGTLALAAFGRLAGSVFADITLLEVGLPVLGFLAGRFLSRDERTRGREQREMPDWAEGPW